MSGYNYGVWPLLGVVAGSIWRYRHNLPWQWRRPTDWNAVRESLGYEAQPDRLVNQAKPPRRQRTWRERLTGRIDWDAERRWLGYGVTLEGEYLPLTDRSVRRAP